MMRDFGRKVDPHGDPREFTQCPIAVRVIEELQAQLDLPDLPQSARLQSRLSASGLSGSHRGVVARCLLCFATRPKWQSEALGRAVAKSDCDSIYNVHGGKYGQVAVSGARKVLRGSGITITTLWGHGYEVSPEHQRALKAWIADKLESTA